MSQSAVFSLYSVFSLYWIHIWMLLSQKSNHVQHIARYPISVQQWGHAGFVLSTCLCPLLKFFGKAKYSQTGDLKDAGGSSSTGFGVTIVTRLHQWTCANSVAKLRFWKYHISFDWSSGMHVTCMVIDKTIFIWITTCIEPSVLSRAVQTHVLLDPYLPHICLWWFVLSKKTLLSWNWDSGYCLFRVSCVLPMFPWDSSGFLCFAIMWIGYTTVPLCLNEYVNVFVHGTLH